MYHVKPEKVFCRSCPMVQLLERDSTQPFYFDYLIFWDLEECEIYIPSYLILLQYNLEYLALVFIPSSWFSWIDCFFSEFNQILE